MSGSQIEISVDLEIGRLYPYRESSTIFEIMGE
jgi:hypothetical protein